MTAPARRALASSDGTNTGAFGPAEWALIGTVSLIWGSSFLWIKIGLDVLHPGALAFIRIALGAFAVSLLPASRTPVPRSVYPTIGIVALCGTIGPALLFAFAEQRIESSVAGMINSIGPLLTLAVSVVMLRKTPAVIQMVGLAVGFAGAVLLAIPNVTGAEAEPFGVALVVLAVCCYSISSNVLPPVVQEYGAIPIMARGIGLAAMVMVPYGLYGLSRSQFSWAAAGAMLVLGVFGTGIARVMFADLLGRAGAPRASLVGYLVPLVAVALGVVVRNESVTLLELGGLGLILLAAHFVGRGRS